MGKACEIFTFGVQRKLAPKRAEKPKRQYGKPVEIKFEVAGKKIMQDRAVSSIPTPTMPDVALAAVNGQDNAFVNFELSDERNILMHLSSLSSYFEGKRDEVNPVHKTKKAEASKRYSFYNALYLSEQYAAGLMQLDFPRHDLLSDISKRMKVFLGIPLSVDKVADRVGKVDKKFLYSALDHCEDDQTRSHIFYMIGNCTYPTTTYFGSEETKEVAFESIKAYIKAIELNPSFMPAYSKLLLLYNKIKDSNEAQKIQAKINEIKEINGQVAIKA